MAIAAQPTLDEDQVVHLKLPWAVYETLVETLGDDSHVRLTYDGEYLEIMSPGGPHDFLSSFIGNMILAIRDEWPVEITSYQTTTFKAAKAARGFEGDQSYDIGDIENRIEAVWNPDISTDPAPDLVLEVDITHKSRDEFETFLRLGVPELWHYTKKALIWYALAGDAYVPIMTSRMIPGLPLVEFANRVAVRSQARRRHLLPAGAKQSTITRMIGSSRATRTCAIASRRYGERRGPPGKRLVDLSAGREITLVHRTDVASAIGLIRPSGEGEHAGGRGRGARAGKQSRGGTNACRSGNDLILEGVARMSQVTRCLIALGALVFVQQTPPPAPAADALFARAVAVVENDARTPYATYTVVVTVTNDERRATSSWQTTEDIRHGVVLASSFSQEERANPTTPHGANIVAHRRIQLSAPRNLDPGVDPSTSLSLKSNPVNPERTGDMIGPVALAVDQNFGLTRPRAYRVANDERTIDASADELTLIGRTGTAAPRYRVALLDTDGGIAHLELTPLRDPYRNRLRELWIETASAYAREAIVQGVGDRAPFDRARWHVTFDRRAGATFVTEAHTVEPLTIGGASPHIGIEFENLELLARSPIKATFGIEAPVRYLRDP